MAYFVHGGWRLVVLEGSRSCDGYQRGLTANVVDAESRASQILSTCFGARPLVVEVLHRSLRLRSILVFGCQTLLET